MRFFIDLEAFEALGAFEALETFGAFPPFILLYLLRINARILAYATLAVNAGIVAPVVVSVIGPSAIAIATSGG